MRMAFGLISLLVTLGIIMLVMGMMLDQQTGSITVAKNAREEAKQIAGIGADGEAATQSAYFEDGQTGGRFGKLIVTRVISGGAYDTYFGLQQGDEIVEIGQSGSLMRVADISNGDSGLARALISDAYARQQQIVVIRNGQRVTLPGAPATPAPAVAAAPTTLPAAPAAAQTPAEESGNPLSRQLDKIKNAGGGAAN